MQSSRKGSRIAGLRAVADSRGVRLASSGERASPGDGFFGDLTEEGERLLFNLQPPRYQPLLTLQLTDHRAFTTIAVRS